MAESHDIARWSAAEEGPFFERKSALDRSGSRPKPRKAADIAHDIAETLVAFANADGGELVVGIEDDGTISGVLHAAGSSRGTGRYYVPGPRLMLQSQTSQEGPETATMPRETATMPEGTPLHQSPIHRSPGRLLQ